MAHRLGTAALVTLALGSAAQAEPVCMKTLLVGAYGTMPIVVEVASTPESRAQGLMHRQSMPLNRGMLFLFEEADRHGFWMMDTLIPLDIVPIDAEGTLLPVLQGIPQSTETLVPSAPVQRILEVNAGLVAAMGADEGRGRFVVMGGTDCDPPTTPPPLPSTP